MRHLIYISLLFLLAACTEPITLDYGSARQQLCVEGSVTTDLIVQSVKLTKTVPYAYNKPMPAVNNAVVWVTAQSDSIPYVADSEIEGLYISKYPFRGKENTRYVLHIDNVLLDDVNEPLSFTAADSLPAILPVDSITVDYDDRIEAWSIDVYANEPQETEDWYLFKCAINSTMVTDTISEWWAADDKFLKGKLEGIQVQELQDEIDDERPAIGDTIWLELNHISKAYHGFCEDVQDETRPSIPLFSGEPANISTNILPNGVGYFSVSAVTRTYTIVNEIPYPGYNDKK